MALKLLILGIGTVGKALLRILENRKEFQICGIASSKGYIFFKDGIPKDDLKKVAANKNLGELSGFVGKPANEIIEHGEYDILIELTVTNLKDAEPAYSYMKAALSRGKHLITSNKGPLALHFRELDTLAKKNNCIFGFEATVCGAIPVFATANNYLAGDKIRSIRGILNGTTNYILTRMFEEKLPYDSALKEAQQLGYAERDPTYDVEGIDASAKLAIVANAIFGYDVSFQKINRIGISRITPEIIELAESSNYRVKLICSANIDGNIEVAPKFVPLSDPLAAINGSLNAITFETDMAGPLTFIGKGAGGVETASAVFADLINLTKLYKTCKH